MAKILIINGPNLNLLGLREPAIYGGKTYADLCRYVDAAAKEIGVEISVFQSNHEGAIVDAIQAARKACDGIVINPAAYTHTSIAILDALKAVALPTVEVHLSDVNAREEFRKRSYVSLAAIKTIAGRHFEGYREALQLLADIFNGKAG